MKNITAYIFLPLVLTLCFSCVKETDLLTEGEPEVIQQEGETRLVTGIVKDTSGTIVAQAGVKIILDELELQTEADENGVWSLSVPTSLTEGFIVANKVQYSKSIQRFNITAENVAEDIYLIEDQFNTELDLSIVQSNLKVVIGRFIDENTNPIPGVLIISYGLLEIPQNEFIFHSIIETRFDGTFELIYEDTNLISSTIQTLFAGACSNNLTIPLQGIDLLEDLGDISLSTNSFSVFQTSIESDGSSCYGDVSTLSYYFDLNSGFLPVLYDQLLGDVSFEYCSDDDGVIYVGVESDDNSNFNGAFIPDDEVEASYMFDICTPSAGDFLELDINGNLTVFDDNLSFVGDRTIISQDPDMPIILTVLSWITSTPLGGSHPRYQIGEIKSLSILGATEITFNNIDDESAFNYVNVVQDDDAYFAGIVRAKLLASDSSEVDIKIRFRVAK